MEDATVWYYWRCLAGSRRKESNPGSPAQHSNPSSCIALLSVTSLASLLRSKHTRRHLNFTRPSKTAATGHRQEAQVYVHASCNLTVKRRLFCLPHLTTTTNVQNSRPPSFLRGIFKVILPSQPRARQCSPAPPKSQKSHFNQKVGGNDRERHRVGREYG